MRKKLQAERKRDMRFNSSAMSSVVVYKYLRADHDTKIPQIGWFLLPTLLSEKKVCCVQEFLLKFNATSRSSMVFYG